MSSATKAPGAEGPGDWVLVPREPTDEMIFAAAGVRPGDLSYPAKAHMLRFDYRAMIASAPAPSDPAGAGGDLGEAREALARMKARDGEDVYEWASRLAGDLVRAGEAEFDSGQLVASTPGQKGAVCGWQPISEAPLDTEVEVSVGQMTFLAKLVPGAAMDTNETVCDQWQATREGEHPPCWSDGCCWTVNEDENCSLWPEAWRPALGTEAEGQDAEGSLVHEGPADLSATPAQTPPSPPSAMPEGDPPMTVKEARELLDGLPKDRTPEQHITYRRWQASEPRFQQVAELCLCRAEQIELALRTLHVAGELR